jgi:hypothetical protein
MAAEHAASELAHQGPTAGEYIAHHLTHWQNHPMKGVIDFSVYNYDSILVGSVGRFGLLLLVESRQVRYRRCARALSSRC